LKNCEGSLITERRREINHPQKIPALGGYLVQEISWRAIFFLALPSGIASLVLTFAIIPRDVPQAG
jgi:hypothetical protein